MKRVFLIVLDSVGIGEMPDAAGLWRCWKQYHKSGSIQSVFFDAEHEETWIF